MQNWKSQIWVILKEGCKQNLWRTKYHIDTFHRPIRGGIVHPNLFVALNITNNVDFLDELKKNENIITMLLL